MLLSSLAAAGAAHAANNAAFVSQNVPAGMAPGQTYAVSVTMQNTGTTTWTAAGAYRLGSQNPQDNTTWGTNRVSLPSGSSVAPGANVTFSFNVTAPATKGTYNFQWRIVQDGVEWFGALSTNVAVKDGLNDASFVSQSVPSVMTPGQTYAVSVTMQNTGGTTWSAGAAYRLGSQNPQDNTTWGTSRVSLPGGSSVAPGANVTFSFNVTAPATAGTYNFQWRMVQDGVEWFGALSANAAVRVGLDNAQFVSQNVPVAMTPGQTYTVSVSMQNTGSTTWSAGTVGLGSQNPQDNTTWGFNRVWLTNAVAPGETATFSFSVTAPSTAGTYNFQWRMVEGSLGWFGAATPNVAVNNGPDDAQFVSQNVPATMTPGQSYSVSVTMQNTGAGTWSPASLHRLGSQNLPDNTVWGLSRVELPGPVAPGASVTFTFNVIAPAASGRYNFQWRMLRGDNVWFGASSSNVSVTVGTPLANMSFIQVDHLNTPRLVADAQQRTVWKWDHQEPFGVNVPDENPSGLGAFDLPLRLPGQYYDKETNLHYNYFRDYDPGIGRYVESDPIGLKGGINTYSYVGASPTNFIDLDGLLTCWYEIYSRALRCSNNAGQTMVTSATISGTGECENNPSCADQPFKGPIPQGVYTIRPPGWISKRPRWLYLDPSSSNQMQGRNQFFFHPQGTISQGCIALLPGDMRTIIDWAKQDGGGTLGVTD